MKRMFGAVIFLGLLVIIYTYQNSSEAEGKLIETATDCFTYEELPDGTLRITGYDEEKNMKIPIR